MNRRGFLKAAGGALSAATAGVALHRGNPAPAAIPMIPGQQVGAMTLVSGPDPGTYAYVSISKSGEMAVVPPNTPAPFDAWRGMAIPRENFPEYDPAHGVVLLDQSLMADDGFLAIRAAYLYALGQRHPDRPLDGNHLSTRFMPRQMIPVKAYLDGLEVQGVNESYSGTNGWLVQHVGTWDGRGRYVPTVFGDSLRYRLLTGNVELRADDAPVWPGDHTAPLLR